MVTHILAEFMVGIAHDTHGMRDIEYCCDLTSRASSDTIKSALFFERALGVTFCEIERYATYGTFELVGEESVARWQLVEDTL